MTDYKVYVVGKSGNPLMPTKRFGKVRKLLESGRARVVNRHPFTIQLLYETTEYTQHLELGIDPGGKDLGVIVREENGELVEAAHLETRTAEVTANMSERKMHRRSRRGHHREKRQQRAKKSKTCFEWKTYRIAGTEKPLRCKRIKPRLIRFHNRRRKEGWLTPTARHLLQTHINFIAGIAARLPVRVVRLEYAKFDLQKLDNPEIEGKEYQSGRKRGYTNTQDYVLCRDRHTCRLCKKSKSELRVHHVIWRSKGGADTPENLVTLCERCHERVHKSPKTDARVRKLFEGMTKRWVHTTLLNSIMLQLHQWLTEHFDKVEVTYGYETKEKRRELGLEKQHHIDAYLISLREIEEAVAIEWDKVTVHEYRQFRRHHRQLIHAVRDRNYKVGNKIVAKNRKKRTGQDHDSLADLVDKQGRQIMASLRVLPGKKVIRSKFDDFRKGDAVRYKGRVYIVKGYGEMGRSLGLVGKKDYVPAKDCRLVALNKGIVCL